MWVIMITEKDASCKSLAPIADAYLRRGHYVEIYALYYSKTVLQDFDTRIPIHSYDDLTEEDIEKTDVIFATTMAGGFIHQKGLLTARKPIFTQNYLVNKQVVWGGDVCFESSNKATENQYTPYLNCCRIEIGEPKYDHVVFNGDGEGLLFIDSGHYPFGEEGKQTLARLLLEICREYPQLVLTVKPRFLPEDEVVTHVNHLHLYDVIAEEAAGSLPSNLHLLYEHQDLADLINRNRTVMCMYTTAFTGVVAAGKGLIVLDQIPSEDTYDLRLKVLMRIKENMEDSGALIDYRKVGEVLPGGTVPTEAYQHFLLAETTNVSEKIVEVTEYLTECFFDRGIAFEKVSCSYSEYQTAFIHGKRLDWDEIIRKRCKDYMILKAFIQIDFRVNAEIQIENALKEIEQEILEWKLTDGSSVTALEKRAKEIQDKCIMENADKMRKDDIDYGILLNTLFLQKKYSQIKEMPPRELGADHFYRARVAYEEGNQEQEFFELEKYMDVTLGRAYIKEISDMSNNKFWGFSRYISLLAEHRGVEEVRKYFALMKQFFHGLYGVEATKDHVTSSNKVHYRFIEQAGNVLAMAELTEKILNIASSCVVLVTAGKMTRQMIGLLDAAGVLERVAGIVDNDRVKQGTMIDGVKIYPVNHKFDEPLYVFTTVRKDVYEILRTQLEEMMGKIRFIGYFEEGRE